MEPEHFFLPPNGWVPNHPFLPVLCYRHVLAIRGVEAMAGRLEGTLADNGWPPQWRDGIYDYHHYHSTAHEVLGCAGGSAELVLGGPGGRVLFLSAGDVAVLPAGTGHCCTAHSPDFLVVGAYPARQQWDVCRSAPTAEMRARVASLPFPDGDPVQGAGGAMTRLWEHPKHDPQT